MSLEGACGGITEVACQNVTIGTAVTGGTANSVLIVDSSGNIAQDNPGLTWDPATDALTVEHDGLAATTADGILLLNGTAATGGATVQTSPRLRLRGNAWNSSGSQSETQDWYIETLPATAAGATTSTLRFVRSLNGGTNTLVGSFSSAGNFAMASTGEFRTSTGSNAAYTGNGIRAGSLSNSVSLGYAGSASSYSGEVVAYGQTHSTKPGVVEIRTGTASAQQAVTLTVDASGNLLAGTDNTQDIGAVGATRYRTGYFGTSVVTDLYIGGIFPLSGAGAVGTAQMHTDYTSTGALQALTLANGIVGQIKTITHVVDGGSGVLTPTTKIGFTTITFTNVGDSVTLRYTAQGWAIIGIFGAIAA